MLTDIIVLAGQSGSQYSFNCYPWGQRSVLPYGGVYAVVKQLPPHLHALYTLCPEPHVVSSGSISYEIGYIGQTHDLSTRPLPQHERMNDFKSFEASHVGIYHCDNEDDRRWIEADLIAALQPPLNQMAGVDMFKVRG